VFYMVRIEPSKLFCDWALILLVINLDDESTLERIMFLVEIELMGFVKPSSWFTS
jgi:hypothetical protein